MRRFARRLKKNVLQPWRTQRFCIRGQDAARLVRQEQVLDAYAWPLNDDEPLVAMDEACKQLHAARPAAAAAHAGHTAEDRKYQRHGTRALFMSSPLLGWRRVSQSSAHAD